MIAPFFCCTRPSKIDYLLDRAYLRGHSCWCFSYGLGCAEYIVSVESLRDLRAFRNQEELSRPSNPNWITLLGRDCAIPYRM